MATGGAAAEPLWLLRREVAARARQRWVSARGRGLRLGPFLRDRQGAGGGGAKGAKGGRGGYWGLGGGLRGDYGGWGG